MRRPLSSAERAVLVAVVLAVGLLLRVGFALDTVVVDPVRADAAHYVQYARNLHAHGVYGLGGGAPPAPDSFRSPGYPAFLLLHLWVFGEDTFCAAVRFTQAVLDGVTVWLAFAIARRLLPFPAALAAAALTACSPHLVANTGYLLTETLTTFALVLAVWALLRLAAGRGRGWLCGAALALATLSNEALLPLAGLLLFVAWRARPDPAVRRALLVSAAVCAVAQGAWQVRNASLPAGALRGSSRALQTISHGTYPDFVFHDPRYRLMPYREDPEQPRYGTDPAHFVRVFAERVAERPLRYASWYALEKPLHVWGFDGLQATREIYVYPVARSVYDERPAANLTLAAMRALHWPIVALMAVGLVFARRRPRAACDLLPYRLLGVCILWGTALGVVFAPWPRYVMPMRPLSFVLAAWGGLCLWRALTRQRAAPAERPGGSVEDAAPRREEPVTVG
ncbi:MAG TPA: glycosyltransferase family 39 protein [Planctomycetota bacterium]|nr:glycosyltransferase family 39 protein [Planctomycetota bacterium]